MAHEFDGKKYEKSSAHQKEWGAKLIAELGLQGHEQVLDLGCGDGANTAMLAELVPRGRVLGIDASQGMIEAALPKQSANLSFQLVDIDNLNFEDQFDVIYSNATLHWVKDHQRLLQNVYKALKDNGLARFNFAADGNCSHFFKVARRAIAKDEFAGFFAEFTWPWYMPPLDEYTGLAEDSDFQKVKVWGENADRYFPDVDTMVAWVDQPCLVPFLAYVPQPHKAAFRDYVVEEMIKETKQDDGRCFETFRRVNLLARK